MKNYDKNTTSSFFMYLDANNLYGWAMFQKIPVHGFKWVKELSKFNQSFKKSYKENSGRGYFLEVDEYPENLFNSHKDLSFLPERKKIEKNHQLICDIKDKEKYVLHKRALKQALNHGLTLRKVHKITHFNSKSMVKTIHQHEY